MWPINNAPSLAYCAPIFHLNEDILFLICETLISEPTPANDRLAHAKAFSETCRRCRYIAAPIILHTVRLLSDQVRLGATLETLERCQDNKNCIRRVSIETPDLDCFPGTDTSAMLMRRLARALNSLTSMESLTMDIILPRWSDLRRAFLEEVGPLPQVKELRLCAELAPLAERCVNATSLFGILLPSDWTILDATRQMNNIQRFDLQTYWETKHVKALLYARPDLRELGMLSSENLVYQDLDLEPPFQLLANRASANYRQAYRGDFRRMLAVLAQFWNLRTLAITFPDNGPSPQPLDIRIQRLLEFVTNDVFFACRALEVLWIGESVRATVVRDSFGGIDRVRIGHGKRRAVAERRCVSLEQEQSAGQWRVG